MTDHTKAHTDGIMSCFHNPKNYLIDEKNMIIEKCIKTNERNYIYDTGITVQKTKVQQI